MVCWVEGHIVQEELHVFSLNDILVSVRASDSRAAVVYSAACAVRCHFNKGVIQWFQSAQHTGSAAI